MCTARMTADWATNESEVLCFHEATSRNREERLSKQFLFFLNYFSEFYVGVFVLKSYESSELSSGFSQISNRNMACMVIWYL